MQVRYFVAHQGRQIGPMEFSEIETRLDQKRLFPTDYVYVTEDKARWLPILDFILVYGPKRRVVEPMLQTEGARHAGDSEVDWQRFASGLPMVDPQIDEKSNPAIAKLAYPTPDVVAPPEVNTAPKPTPKVESPRAQKTVSALPEYPPPPTAPRAIIEKRILEAAVRRPATPKRPPIPQPIESIAPRTESRRPALPPTPRTFKPTAPPQALAQVDVSATAQVDVLPPRATKLHIQINGEARVGEVLEITVHAVAESGSVDHTFDEIIHLGCNRPVQGLAPLQFTDGIARIQVRCLASGQHQFFLSLDPTHKPGRHIAPGEVSRELAH